MRPTLRDAARWLSIGHTQVKTVQSRYRRWRGSEFRRDWNRDSLDFALYRYAARRVVAGLVRENRALRQNQALAESRNLARLVKAMIERMER